MKLHDEDGRELRRVYVTVPAAEAEAFLRMIEAAGKGVRQARDADDPATDFMFVLGSTGSEPNGSGTSTPLH